MNKLKRRSQKRIDKNETRKFYVASHSELETPLGNRENILDIENVDLFIELTASFNLSTCKVFSYHLISYVIWSSSGGCYYHNIVLINRHFDAYDKALQSFYYEKQRCQHLNLLETILNTPDKYIRRNHYCEKSKSHGRRRKIKIGGNHTSVFNNTIYIERFPFIKDDGKVIT